MHLHSSEQKIHYTLRVATAMCFIGHGCFGIITKPIWCNYFAVFGIGKALAYQLMPIVGIIDILLGILILIYPMRIIPAWLVAWGLITAALRPLSGEPFAEFIERAGNFGAPLAFLILARSASGGGIKRGLSKWFERVSPASRLSPDAERQLRLCLRIIVFGLLLGHGWLNMIGKKGLIDQYAHLGFADPLLTAEITGAFEIAAACAILIKPVRPLLMALFIWKMGTELFYPRWELFEWVERGGSYGSLLALWFITRPRYTPFVSLAT